MTDRVPDRLDYKEKRFRTKYIIAAAILSVLSGIHVAFWSAPPDLELCSSTWCSFLLMSLNELLAYGLYYLVFDFIIVVVYNFLTSYWQQRLEPLPERGPSPSYGDISVRDRETKRIVLLVVAGLLSLNISFPRAGGIFYPIRALIVVSGFEYPDYFVILSRYILPLTMLVIAVRIAYRAAQRFARLKDMEDESLALKVVAASERLIPIVEIPNSTAYVPTHCILKPCMAKRITVEKLGRDFVESEFANTSVAHEINAMRREGIDHLRELSSLRTGTQFLRIEYDRHFNHILFPRNGEEAFLSDVAALLDDTRRDCGLPGIENSELPQK